MHEATQCLITLVWFGFLIQMSLCKSWTILKRRHVITVLFPFGIVTPAYMCNHAAIQSQSYLFCCLLLQKTYTVFHYFLLLLRGRMTAWNPIYLSSTLKILSGKHFAWNYLIKAFEILIWMWNWEAVVKASVSIFSPSFNPNFFLWGREYRLTGSKWGGWGVAAEEHLCGCAAWERITYVYAFVQMWMYLCYSCLFCVPLCSEWGERWLDFWNTVNKPEPC